MTEAIITALITGGLSLVGVVITCNANARKNARNNETAQAVMETKLEALTGEVRAHNNFAQRMPVLEADVKTLKHDVDTLKRYHMQPTK